MPSEVGIGLQAAQDDIQSVSGDPLYFTSSHDATGQERHQIWDRELEGMQSERRTRYAGSGRYGHHVQRREAL